MNETIWPLGLQLFGEAAPEGAEAPEAAPEAGIRDWGEVHSQAEEARALYPDLDLMAELGNPEFDRLAAAGVPVRTAYEVVHREEILGGAMAYAVRETTRKLSGAVMSGSARPQESGMGGPGAALHRLDPRSLSQRERQALRDRVMRGERVVL